MKKLIVLALVFAATVSQASDKIKFNFLNEDLVNVVKAYSVASG